MSDVIGKLISWKGPGNAFGPCKHSREANHWLWLLPLFFLLASAAKGQPIEWQTNLGGSENEKANCIRQTNDGGYMVAGWSSSNDQDLNGNYGSIARPDVWLVKLDGQGQVSWTRRYGGSRTDKATSVRQTQDGGYIVAGVSGSDDQDVANHYGSGITKDYWILKLDGSGNIEWKDTYGGLGDDFAFAVRQTADGNYAVAGHSSSDTRDVSTNYGSRDYWLVKLKAGTGQIMWERNYGGSGTDQATTLLQTAGGGFVVAGHSQSADSNVSDNYGNWDYWVTKLKPNGDIIWENNLGGTRPDLVTDMVKTDNGNYVVAGITQSKDEDVSKAFLGEDYWVVKLDGGKGSIIWEATYGTDGIEQCQSIDQTADNGFILGGGEEQFRPVKVDQGGRKEWENRFGGSDDDDAFSIQQISDGGTVMAGVANSSDGDLSGNKGGTDIWVVKLGPKSGCTPARSTINPEVCRSYQSPSGDETYRTSGNYKDTLKNATVDGCDSIITINLTVQNVDSSVNKTGETLEANTSGATYQWLDCKNNYAPVSEATSQSFSPETSGEYAVAVTNNGCTDTSQCYQIQTTGIATNTDGKGLDIYPNPATDQITIVQQGNLEPRTFDLQTLTGRTVQSGKLAGKGRHTIDVSDLSAGVYLLQVKTDEAVRTKKVIVK